ncbi:Carboxylic ester hydrolase [Venustampulla echinocandica]|uniref:Carboxylic ester hydrolase n=1 Tax=Venustampulla echinocandica TaxID=2656787 RepID=A0A370U3M3_9HELO|nr:Carboxylic ester hydrolase [Venustampulla echinocandica]RDL42381.1 Carboxylic ester hydrolase [Venustampulla echinocandica]
MKSIIAFLSILPVIFAIPTPDKRAAAPTVAIASPAATIIGSSISSIDSFNGIPFAQPPTGALRLKPPQPLNAPLGTVKAVGIPKACPQLYFSNNPNDFPAGVLGTIMNTPLFQAASNAGEDCLTLNIIRPAGLTASSKVPVLFWIFGGGFGLGSTQMYDGHSLVAASVAAGKPIIFVAVNYRVGGFGFLPGKEILADGSANLGLQDQRLGLKWVADNIAAFGGDPEKVTMWGESAGSISVLDQIVLYDGDNKYNGKPLFRGAIMSSGSVVPADPVDCPKGQAVYDSVVAKAGCSSATSTLECLRALPYISLLNAVNSVPGILSYNSVALSYLPRPDGSVLTASPDVLVSQGKWAKVPFIVGDQEDEGTLFALFQPNITTKPQVVEYLSDLFFHSATTAQLTALVDTYQNIATDGSPFRTLLFNNWYPQFKRLAAILGDLVFTLTRRIFLDMASTEVPSWSYLSSYDYGTPILGSFHGGDILQVFYGVLPNYASRAIRDYYFNFVHTMDPNNGSEFMEWPQWSEKRQLMNFYATGANLINDDFRSDSYEFIKTNVGSLYI